jgi:UDPglucose 6-dehydrogenase
MKIGIVGATGIVGNAVYEFFRQKGITTFAYSRKMEEQGLASKEEINGCDIAFVCVPTPMYEDKFGVNLDAIHDVMAWLDTPIIVIKSTVPPGTTNELAFKYRKCILHNPEFLTEKNSIKDMENADHVLIGYPDGCYKKEADEIRELYEKCYTSDVKIFVVPTGVTELVKYMRNAYLATKVIFCNEMYDICNKLGIDWNLAREMWLLDKRITRSHTVVTEERGYSGMCFPKDVKGLIGFSDSELMKTIYELNKKMRKE